jgi:hypothetical protein
MLEIGEKYENRTYKESFTHACNLIPLMYKRLTQVDGFSYEDAVNKIWHDHSDVRGFSKRNIYRYLPKDLPDIPRRIVTSRHNSSQTESTQGTNLSDTKSSTTLGSLPIADENQCPSCLNLLAVNNELREALEASQNFTSADTLLRSERVCSVPKDKEYVMTDALKKSERVCYIFFNVAGRVVHAEADVDKMNNGNGHQ